MTTFFDRLVNATVLVFLVGSTLVDCLLLGLALGLLVACACRLASRFVDAILRFVALGSSCLLALLGSALVDCLLLGLALGLLVACACCRSWTCLDLLCRW